jgi:Ser/Thr protein kinase RdoA (MazF antagonist)
VFPHSGCFYSNTNQQMMNDETFLHLAIEALRNYGLENVQLTRLGGASNTNFKVDADDKSYVLRLHRSAYHDLGTP